MELIFTALVALFFSTNCTYGQVTKYYAYFDPFLQPSPISFNNTQSSMNYSTITKYDRSNIGSSIDDDSKIVRSSLNKLSKTPMLPTSGFYSMDILGKPSNHLYISQPRHYSPLNWKEINNIIYPPTTPNVNLYVDLYKENDSFLKNPLNIPTYDYNYNLIPPFSDYGSYFDLAIKEESPAANTTATQSVASDNSSQQEVPTHQHAEIEINDLDYKDSTQHFVNSTHNFEIGPLNFFPTKIRRIFPLPNGSVFSLNSKLVIPFTSVPSTSAWSLIGDYRFSIIVNLPNLTPAKYREKRLAVAYERAAIYGLMSDFLSKLGLDGEACLLRSVCEAGEDPIHEYGFLGDLFNFILSPGYIHDDIHLEYTEAERYGIYNGSCSSKFQGCPVSLREILHSDKRTLMHENTTYIIPWRF